MVWWGSGGGSGGGRNKVCGSLVSGFVEEGRSRGWYVRGVVGSLGGFWVFLGCFWEFLRCFWVCLRGAVRGGGGAPGTSGRRKEWGGGLVCHVAFGTVEVSAHGGASLWLFLPGGRNGRKVGREVGKRKVDRRKVGGGGGRIGSEVLRSGGVKWKF